MAAEKLRLMKRATKIFRETQQFGYSTSNSKGKQLHLENMSLMQHSPKGCVIYLENRVLKSVQFYDGLGICACTVCLLALSY